MTEPACQIRNNPLRIACVIHSLNGGGAERVMSGLVGSLRERGHEVSLICLDDGTRDRYPVDPGVRRVLLNVMSDDPANSGPIHRLRTLRSSIMGESPDVVLSFCDATNLLVLLATQWLDTPVVVCERSDPRRQQMSRVKERLRTILYRRANQVVAQTSEVAEYLSKRLDRNVHAIGSAIKDTSIPSHRNQDAGKSPQTGESPHMIVTVGRCEREKGWDRLVDAVARLPGDLNWRLKLVGDGSLRAELEAYTQERSLDHCVEWIGWSQDVVQHLRCADVFVLPSRYEGFPSALLEAMSVGLPVVAFDASPGIRECVTNGHNGILVTNDPPDDISKLSEAIERVLTSDQLREQLGKNALHSSGSHNWDTMVDQFERVLIEAAQY